MAIDYKTFDLIQRRINKNKSPFLTNPIWQRVRYLIKKITIFLNRRDLLQIDHFSPKK